MVLITPIGVHWLAWFSDHSERLHIQSIEGPRLNDLHIEGLRIEFDKLDLEIGQAHIKWRPGRLLIGELKTLSVMLEDVHLNLLELPQKRNRKKQALKLTGVHKPLKSYL